MHHLTIILLLLLLPPSLAPDTSHIPSPTYAPPPVIGVWGDGVKILDGEKPTPSVLNNSNLINREISELQAARKQ